MARAHWRAQADQNAGWSDVRRSSGRWSGARNSRSCGSARRRRWWPARRTRPPRSASSLKRSLPSELVDLLNGPEPHKHRQECLCHMAAPLMQRFAIGAAGVAQTLLSVLWQDAALDIARTQDVLETGAGA